VLRRVCCRMGTHELARAARGANYLKDRPFVLPRPRTQECHGSAGDGTTFLDLAAKLPVAFLPSYTI
jgi:hypothetical protein